MLVVVRQCSVDLPERSVELVGHVGGGVSAGSEVVHVEDADSRARDPWLPAEYVFSRHNLGHISKFVGNGHKTSVAVIPPNRCALSFQRRIRTHFTQGSNSPHMRILVTGGAGFIGGHLAAAFLRDGHDVTVLDNLEPFYDVRLKEHTLDVHREVASAHEGSYTFREGDVRDAQTVQEVVADADVVVHQAAQAGVRTSVTEPQKVTDINVGGTVTLLEAAEDAGVERVILASSSSVYGKPESLPYAEDHPTEPVSPYGVTKLAQEHMARVYTELRKIRGESLALQGSDEADQQYSTADDGTDGVLTQSLKRLTVIVCIDGEEYPSREIRTLLPHSVRAEISAFAPDGEDEGTSRNHLRGNL